MSASDMYAFENINGDDAFMLSGASSKLSGMQEITVSMHIRTASSSPQCILGMGKKSDFEAFNVVLGPNGQHVGVVFGATETIMRPQEEMQHPSMMVCGTISF